MLPRLASGAAIAALVTTTLVASPATGAVTAPPGGRAVAPPPASAPLIPAVPRAPAAAADPYVQPCGRRSTPARWQHVVWIWLENHSRDQVIGAPGSAVATSHPALNRMARACGYAARYTGITHPSLPNYLAAVSGTTFGLKATCTPARCPQRGTTLFDLARRSGRGWLTAADAMPRPCATRDSGRYAVRHNAAAYFPAARAACRPRSLPMGTPARGVLATRLARDTLPAFTWLVPDLCHSGHDCSSATADRWLGSWLPSLLRSPAYRAGTTAVFISFDEGEGGTRGMSCRTSPDTSCEVATVVVSPSTRPGSVSMRRFDHYSLLRTTQELLALRPLLRAASTAPSMRAPFGL